MENTPRLYDTLVQVLSQHRQWLDVRHLKTLAWMMVGLIESGLISLTSWAPFVHGRAVFAQSSVRRFARWLDNERIEVHQLYGPLIQQALGSWGRHTLYLALDTSLLWEQYCVIRISVIYRGRAIPLVWQVLEHASSSVAYATYQPFWTRPPRCCRSPVGSCFWPIAVLPIRRSWRTPPSWVGTGVFASRAALWSIGAASGSSNSATMRSNRARRTSGSMCTSPRALWPGVSGLGAPRRKWRTLVCGQR